MSTLTIGALARHSGFSASALRYYEDVGLLAPTARTDAGYRLYGADALARLALIRRAKELGCTLEEIAAVLGVWDGHRCGPVQRRFHQLLRGKLADARRQVAELDAFAADLQTAATQLLSEPVDGPCDAECACLSTPLGEAEPVAMTRAVGADVCQLEPDELRERVGRWHAVLASAHRRTTAADGARRIEFGAGVDLACLAELISGEQHCCASLTFTLTVDATGVALEVRAPDTAAAVVSALFGPQAGLRNPHARSTPQ